MKRKLNRKNSNKSAIGHFIDKTFSVKLIEKSANRFSSKIDGRILPGMLKGQDFPTNGRCTLCGVKWAYPYRVCRDCRENATIRRYVKEMEESGEIECVGRGTHNVKIYSNVGKNREV